MHSSGILSILYLKSSFELLIFFLDFDLELIIVFYIFLDLALVFGNCFVKLLKNELFDPKPKLVLLFFILFVYFVLKNSNF